MYGQDVRFGGYFLDGIDPVRQDHRMTTATTQIGHTTRKAGRVAKTAIVEGLWDTDDAWLDAMDEAYDAMSVSRRNGVTVGRDCLGRFTHREHIDNPEIVWHNGTDGASHAIATCANIAGSKRRPGGEIVTTGARTGWACPACVHTDMTVREMIVRTRDIAPSSGTQVCEECDIERALTAFPTIVISHFRMRAVICRKCEGAARAAGTPMDNFVRTSARYVWDMDDHDILRPGETEEATAARIAEVARGMFGQRRTAA